jgi:DNA-binding NtrC family response regulator
MEDKMSHKSEVSAINSRIESSVSQTSLADRFKQKTLELAREGFLGSLRTKRPSLQASFANLLHLIDQSHVPILLFGESGTGKRRLVDEYFILHNFYRRLDNLKQGQLRVYKSEFLQKGWVDFFSPKHNGHADLIYIENVDRLSLERQNELLKFLKFRKQKAKTLMDIPRIVLGTEKSLSLMVMQGTFLRDLFNEITSFAVFLPTLQERSEDILDIIQSFSFEISGRTHQPPTWFVDFVSHHMWDRNLDELKMLMRNMFLKRRDMRSWDFSDLPILYTQDPSESSFSEHGAPDVSSELNERSLIQKNLAKFDGDREKTARHMGFTRSEFLQKLLSYQIR